MSRWWEQTADLALDDEGLLYHLVADRVGDRRPVRLGPIGWAEAPPGLGPQLAELLDAWRDSVPRESLHREWYACYRASRL